MDGTRCSTLLLTPTELEARRLSDRGGFPPALGELRTCGFGPVVAAARTAALIAALRPERALLIGIAGSFDTGALAVGDAAEFAAVAIEGIGAGEGAELLGPPALGFPQWPGGDDASPRIEDRVALAAQGGDACRALLLTTCAASASPAQAALRRERHPTAAAEDMEGFAVAAACALAGVPLRIVRGISNAVGHRDPTDWRIPAALAAAHELARELLNEPGDWSAAK